MKVYSIKRIYQEMDMYGFLFDCFRIDANWIKPCYKPMFRRGRLREHNRSRKTWFISDENCEKDPPAVVWMPYYKQKKLMMVMPGDGYIPFTGIMEYISNDEVVIRQGYRPLAFPMRTIMNKESLTASKIQTTLHVDYWFVIQCFDMNALFNQGVKPIWLKG